MELATKSKKTQKTPRGHEIPIPKRGDVFKRGEGVRAKY
jgi:hypothetical protein